MGECNLTGHSGGSGGGLEEKVNEHIANTSLHPRFACGRYGSASAGNTTSVYLGFRPKMVFVSCETELSNLGVQKFSAAPDGHLNMALALDGYPGMGVQGVGGKTSEVRITDTGFTVSAGYNRPGLANFAGSYFAIG